jgi:hypothetical protein
MNKYFSHLYFDDPEPQPSNVTASTDIEPAKSIDHVNRFGMGIKGLMEVLGVTEMESLRDGDTINIYKYTVSGGGDQSAEGEEIPLTKVERKLARALKIVTKLYRKLTTIQALNKNREVALEGTDKALVNKAQKDVRDVFYTVLATGTGTATAGATLQAAIANAWAALTTYFKDEVATPIMFVNNEDVATYLGTAGISTQTAFGFSYIQNFMGIGTAIITPDVAKGTVYMTAAENLHGAYVGQDSETADAMGMAYDETGLVGMVHAVNTARGGIETLLATGIVFYPEDLAGVIVGGIS